MNSLNAQIKQSAAFVSRQMPFVPRIAIMTGTGLGAVVDAMEINGSINYAEIPHFPLSTVQSHAGRLLTGTLAGRAALAFQGRIHLYEGYTPDQVAYPVRLMKALGVDTLVVTNAAGGINPAFVPGDLMVIRDHVNLTGSTPLAGPNDDTLGPRFPDMARAYDPELIRAARTAGELTGKPLRQGVYAGLLGPSLETPAEIRFLKTIGCDAVGLSTVMEVIAAVHAGIRVSGLSIITNVHDPDRPEPAKVDEIIALAQQTAPSISRIIQELIKNSCPGDVDSHGASKTDAV